MQLLHFLPFLLAPLALALAFPAPRGAPGPAPIVNEPSPLSEATVFLRKRGSLARAYVHWELERSVAPPSLSRRSPQLLGALGAGARAVGKGASKAGDKAGEKAGKEQGKNAGQDGGDHQKTADMMAGNLKKIGYKDADPKCLKAMVDKFSVSGGVNGNYSGCWEKKKPGIGDQASEARTKAFEGAKKKGLM